MRKFLFLLKQKDDIIESRSWFGLETKANMFLYTSVAFFEFFFIKSKTIAENTQNSKLNSNFFSTFQIQRPMTSFQCVEGWSYPQQHRRKVFRLFKHVQYILLLSFPNRLSLPFGIRFAFYCDIQRHTSEQKLDI